VNFSLKSGAPSAAFLLGIRPAGSSIAFTPGAPDISVINDGDTS
jgi:hypothetical protein